MEADKGLVETWVKHGPNHWLDCRMLGIAAGNYLGFRPESRKTEHHGRERVIFIGPSSQDVLRPYLLEKAKLRDAVCALLDPHRGPLEGRWRRVGEALGRK
jgi:hypothetical protein